MSLVLGEQNVTFLKKRYQALKDNPLFQGMEFSDDHNKTNRLDSADYGRTDIDLTDRSHKKRGRNRCQLWCVNTHVV